MWGQMEREEWSRLTDELSEPKKWSAEGKIMHKPLKKTK
jgi:hypothetical protein